MGFSFPQKSYKPCGMASPDGLDPPSVLNNATPDSVEVASSSYSALMSGASSYDGPILSQLDVNSTAAVSHATADVSSLVGAVEQDVSAFVSRARRRQRGADKLLEMKQEELARIVSHLEACMQQALSGEASLESLEDSMHTINIILGGTVVVPTAYMTSGLAALTAARHAVGQASVIDIGIDPCRTVASHPPWLTRGETNLVKIVLSGADGKPVYGMTTDDLMCSFDENACGWRAVSVCIECNSISFGIALATDCIGSALFRVNIRAATHAIPLKAFASPAVIEAAIRECERVASMDTVVSPADMRALIALYRDAGSSPEVALAFLKSVEATCRFRSSFANRTTAAAAGAIEAVVAAMYSHGLADASVAEQACCTLEALSANNANADAVVSAGVPDAICDVMSAHATMLAVQKAACRAVLFIASFASADVVAAMRQGRTVEAILTAQRNHPTPSDLEGFLNGLSMDADEALRTLRGVEMGRSGIRDELEELRAEFE